jgi:integrase
VGLLNALRRMGYGKDKMTIHGFRSMASTLLNEQGYRPDVIEAQLAHGEKDAIRGAYNRAEYLVERRKMMDEWANYLDDLRAQAGHLVEPGANK